MTSSPMILLSGESATFAQLGSYPKTMDQHPIDVYSAFYAAGIQAAGATPIYLPLGVDPHGFIDRVDAVVLTGGADVNPELYGVEGADVMAGPHPPQPDRDRQELALIDAAVAANAPILGICRGLQILNVHGGGTLVQDLPDHPKSDPADANAHTVTLAEGSAMAAMFGSHVAVNSLHHQGIDRLATGWEATGLDHDGRIEAAERADGQALAVQWHPEMMKNRNDDPLFAWIVAKAQIRLDLRNDAKQYRRGEPALG